MRRWLLSGCTVVAAGLLVSACGPVGAGIECMSDADCAPAETCDATYAVCVQAAALSFTGAQLKAYAGRPFQHTVRAEGGKPPYTWTVQNAAPALAWLKLDSQSGVLAGTPDVVAPAAAFEVRVMDAAGGTAVATFHLEVVPCTGECQGECTPGEVCRAAQSACDLEEICTDQGTCPADSVALAGTVCRAAAGPCDVAEVCTGTDALCPPDELEPMGTVCRAAAGACDLEEVCSGTSPQCPEDALVPAGTECRAAAGACDKPEYCSGDSAECPADAVLPAGTTCRASVNVCDVEESCDGANVTCPEDSFRPAYVLCAPGVCSGGIYTPPGTCAGHAAVCQVPSSVSCNGYQCNGATCRTSCTTNSQCMPTHFCTPLSQCAPKRQDGEACSGPSAGYECLSGVCTAMFPDDDEDGFGASNSTPTHLCGTVAPLGWSLNKGDCCDSDYRAFPGQTAYFPHARVGCGGFDWNCDGTQEKEHIQISTCYSSGSCGDGSLSCPAANGVGQPTGWEITAPPCGQPGTFVMACGEETVSCTFWGNRKACSAMTQQRVQACR